MSIAALRHLEQEVPECARCPRLGAYLRELRRRHPDYWNKPVPGFGDRRAWLAIVGLAPGRHGANRSGRPFWLDASGEWLYGELEHQGFWNGARLTGAYLLNAVKCVPPQNRPTGAEQTSCNAWLEQELAALSSLRVVIALGTIAHTAVLRSWDVRPRNRYPFSHRSVHRIDGHPPLLSSYHPSRQNTNTGVLTRPMWRDIFRRAKRLATKPHPRPAGPRPATQAPRQRRAQ